MAAGAVHSAGAVAVPGLVLLGVVLVLLLPLPLKVQLLLEPERLGLLVGLVLQGLAIHGRLARC